MDKLPLSEEEWKIIGVIGGFLASALLILRKLLRPWASGVVLWLLEAEDAKFTAAFVRMILQRQNSPMIKDMIDTLYRDRRTEIDRRISDMESSLDRQEQTIRLAHQNIASLSNVLEGQQGTLELIRETLPKQTVLMETQIENSRALTRTLEGLRSDISEHTRQIGKLEGTIEGLRA